MGIGVIAGGCVRFQAMTKIAAGTEGNTAAQLLNRGAHEIAKTDVIFSREKTVAQGEDATVPTVTLQEIGRHRRSMIEIEITDSHHDQMLVRRGPCDLVKEFVVQFRTHGCGLRTKICEVAESLWAVV